DEALDALALGRLDHPPRRDPVDLLDRASRLVADRGGEVHDGLNAAQGVAEGRGVREVAQGDLHAHSLGAQPPGIAHEAADLDAVAEQMRQQRGARQPGRAGKQEHASYNMRLPAETAAKSDREGSEWPTLSPSHASAPRTTPASRSVPSTASTRRPTSPATTPPRCSTSTPRSASTATHALRPAPSMLASPRTSCPTSGRSTRRSTPSTSPTAASRPRRPQMLGAARSTER